MESTTTAPPSPFDNMSEQVVELLSKGVSLGSIYNYQDEDYEVVYALGHNLYAQERYLDAMKAFGFLVMHNQLERRYVNAFASSLQMLKHYKDAIQYYCMASVMDLGDPMPTFHTAECMIPLGMFADARQALELVVQQSGTPERTALRERAQALLALLERSDATGQPALVGISTSATAESPDSH